MTEQEKKDYMETIVTADGWTASDLMSFEEYLGKPIEKLTNEEIVKMSNKLMYAERKTEIDQQLLNAQKSAENRWEKIKK